MPMLDIFNNNAFSVSSLTSAIEFAKYKPRFLGSLGLFEPRRIRTTTAVIDEKEGNLQLLNTSARGTVGNIHQGRTRRARSFVVPHVPDYAAVLADDVQNVRAFGSESDLETVVDLVNEKLMDMRDNHEVTHEYHRIGAVKGEVLDADGSSVLFNFFTEYGIDEPTAIIDFTDPTLDLKMTFSIITRNIANTLGEALYTGIIGLCGDQFFDNFVTNTEVATAYNLWEQGRFFRELQLGPEYKAQMRGFEYAGITWLNYRGRIGGTDFIPTATCRLFPTGVPGLFQEIYAPGDFMETVNTLGRKFYAKQERMEFDKGVKLHTQSNVLFLCTRPGVLYELTGSFPVGTTTTA